MRGELEEEEEVSEQDCFCGGVSVLGTFFVRSIIACKAASYQVQRSETSLFICLGLFLVLIILSSKLLLGL